MRGVVFHVFPDDVRCGDLDAACFQVVVSLLSSGL
jgi:hypothetical protein